VRRKRLGNVGRNDAKGYPEVGEKLPPARRARGEYDFNSGWVAIGHAFPLEAERGAGVADIVAECDERLVGMR